MNTKTLVRSVIYGVIAIIFPVVVMAQTFTATPSEFADPPPTPQAVLPGVFLTSPNSGDVDVNEVWQLIV